MTGHGWVAAALAAVLTGSGASAALAQSATPQVGAAAAASTTAPQTQTPRNDYGDGAAWLCRPGRTDACSADQSATVIQADGKSSREAFQSNAQAPIDCFYVYPTVSLDPSPNSDMTAGTEEKNVIAAQFARFGSQCRTFAPLYRQVTLSALRRLTAGDTSTPPDRTLAYGDVLDAWKHYLANDNQGRGVVLIGHSQGSGALTRLIREQIDGKPIQKQMVSALLIGTNVAVPKGKDVGGAFQSVPLCRSAKQTGCLVSYVSFRANVPPPSDSRFGRVEGEGMVAACTNPAALAGGKGELRSFLPAGRLPGPGSTGSAVQASKLETPFVALPGLLSAECVSNEKGSYLAVTVNADPKDPRVDDIAGDVVMDGKVVPQWGLHLVDMNLAMGDLVEIVRQQSEAYRSSATR